MTWAPLALAIAFGLIVSAGIYFTIMWPDVEPHDEHDEDETDGAAKSDALD